LPLDGPLGVVGVASVPALVVDPTALDALDVLEPPPEGALSSERASDMWVGGSLGMQSEPLSVVPSGHVPGESAPLPPPHPPRAASTAAPTANFAPQSPVADAPRRTVIVNVAPLMACLMARMIALLAGT
jgi:hypothetical protein